MYFLLAQVPNSPRVPGLSSNRLGDQSRQGSHDLESKGGRANGSLAPAEPAGGQFLLVHPTPEL